MRGAVYSLPFKAGAAILSVLTCLICTLSIFGTAVFMSMGFYSQQEWNYYTSGACSNRTYYRANAVVYDYYSFYTEYQQGGLEEDQNIDGAEEKSSDLEAMAVRTISSMDETLRNYQLTYSAEKTNFRFILAADEEVSPISTYGGEEYGFYQEYTFTVYNSEGQSEKQVNIACYVVDPLTADDEYQSDAYWYGTAFEYRYTVLALAVISSLLIIILCIYLISAAGHKRGSDQIIAGGLHTVPFDLLTVMVAIIGGCVAAIMFDSYDYIGVTEMIIRICVGVTALFSLILFYVMSFAVRCKSHFLWKGTVIYRCYHWIKEMILRLYRNRSLVWRMLLWISLIGFITLMVGGMCIGAGSLEGFLLYVILACLLSGSFALAFQIRYRRIQRGIRQMASGDLNARVDTQGLYGELKEQAENLNRINEAVQTAVEEQLKSERMKTELITNVSHDIKTPLTSIVNYVDLLKKQQVQDETAKEYIEVLERQSIRLKKLIEDLIEASKASTGNIAVDMMQLDMTELLKQVSGEYTDRLRKHDLELVLTAPEGEIPILADGQLLWRVYDNLLSNAQKYSQPGTRVYLDLREEKGHVIITFRNISRYPLNISGEELMERFVRGDSSRHTEGSGLGLSIARSLTELMNGRFEILVDGDLFKAQITFIKLV